MVSRLHAHAAPAVRSRHRRSDHAVAGDQAGELRHVAADRLTDELTGRPYYLAQVTITPQTLGEDLHLRPGMSAEVFLLAHERTPLQYLVDPIRNSVRRALRQPA